MPSRLRSVWRYTSGSIEFTAKIVFGSTSAVTGAVSITLPNSESMTAGGAARAYMPFGQVVCRDNAGSSYTGHLQYSTATTLVVLATTASGTYTTAIGLSSTVPFTWGTSDSLALHASVPLT